jgi:predicted O-linked N-acetylglucosamine transferase (SPINDLY family)
MNVPAAPSINVFELFQQAEALRIGGDSVAAGALYEGWIAGNQGNALLYAAHFNYSIMLSNQGNLLAARDALVTTLELNPEFMPAYINLGGLLERLGAPEQGLFQWAIAVQKLESLNGAGVSHKISALNQMGRVLERMQQDERAEIALRQSLEFEPNQRQVLQHLIALRQRQCEWPVAIPFERVTKENLVRNMSALSLAMYTDSPALQLANSWNYNKEEVPSPRSDYKAPAWATGTRQAGDRLRIGYVSTDLRAHAIGYLMAELFEVHDRNSVEIFAYYCGIPHEDSIKTRIRSAFEHWVDIKNMDDEAVARLIAEDGIDILVDVNAYTGDARNKLFALRPAPIIVNWLGFPGTTGSPYHNYIIADDWIIPEKSEIYYSEKVVCLPCYQPNDRKREVSPVTPTRAEHGLPDGVMVYCCFNAMQKFTRVTFERWMAILVRVPNSVLWLLGSTEPAHQRLRAAAAALGVAPERLIFAGRTMNPDHLARFPLADLFLDTTPYGAHTTSSDAMWMGVPVLTLSGRGFASRVSGSIVRSAGLPELVCSTGAEYIERAVSLAGDRAKLAEYRERLRAGRYSCVLFDTDMLARRLEGLYRGMWDDYQSGRLPRPDLSNLEVYLEVGIDDDFDAIDVMTIDDYEAWYRGKLARRHRYRPIGPDKRLWTQADIEEAERQR